MERLVRARDLGGYTIELDMESTASIRSVLLIGLRPRPAEKMTAWRLD
jgi:hypothetical protein